MSRAVAVVAVFAVVVGMAGRLAAPLPAAAAPTLRSGHSEMGLSGSLTHSDGATNVDLALHGARFRGVGGGAGSRAGAWLVGAEVELGWSHRRQSDLGELLFVPQATRAWSEGSVVWPYVGAILGWRQQWLGSFEDARFPVGATVGLRILTSESSAVRVGYRTVRLLDDPVGDLWEQQVRWGASLLW